MSQEEPKDIFCPEDRPRDALAWFRSRECGSVKAIISDIHGKAVYATRKFRLLKRAIDATLLGLGFMVAALLAALAGRVAS